MKFPTHIILDVSRPTVVNPQNSLAWQKFYYTRFGKTNSLFNKKGFNNENKFNRILVTKTQAVTANNSDLQMIKKTILAGKKLPQNTKVRYFLPYKSEFTKEALTRAKDLIKANKRRLDNSKKQYTNFITVNNSSTKYLFLSDQIVEDFQLEKELFLKFSGNNTSNQPKLDKKRSFKQWTTDLESKRKTHANKTQVLGSQVLREQLVSKAQELDFKNESKLEDLKFCFKGYTVQLNLGKASSRFWNKRIYSQYLHQPSNSRLRNLFNINFLVKEMHYSKLKYSKTAERDIVSSGSAALFAGFIGFLISEKFGIELVDSGDFYFAFMYAVFVGFSLKAFVMGLESHVTNWDRDVDSRAYTHKPAKWLTLGANNFTYFLTLLHLLLRIPHNALHSTYPPFNATLSEFISYMNFGFIFKLILKYTLSTYQFLSSFPSHSSDYYKR